MWILLVLALAEAAEAGDWNEYHWIWQQGKSALLVCGPPGANGVDRVCHMDDKLMEQYVACHQRMQEAMKAAHPYLPHSAPELIWDQPVYRLCDEVCKAKAAVVEAEKKQAMLNQWRTVMEDCVQ